VLRVPPQARGGTSRGDDGPTPTGGTAAALQVAARPGDPLRTDDRLRRGLSGVALSAYQARRTHHRQQTRHRRLPRPGVPQEIAVPARLPRPLDDPTPTVRPSRWLAS